MAKWWKVGDDDIYDDDDDDNDGNCNDHNFDVEKFFGVALMCFIIKKQKHKEKERDRKREWEV